jgi:hypothetical protein
MIKLKTSELASFKGMEVELNPLRAGACAELELATIGCHRSKEDE